MASLCGLIDPFAAGMGLASCDVTILRAVFDTLANHYPERMGQLWMFDAPLVFWGLWKVRILGPVARECACSAQTSCVYIEAAPRAR